MSRPWTNEDSESLKKLYGTMPLKELASILNRHGTYLCIKAKKLGIQSSKSKLTMEQLFLKKSNQRRCYKCKQIMPFINEFFYASKRCCRKCERKIAIINFYNLKNNPTLPKVMMSRLYASKSRARSKKIDFNLDISYLLVLWTKQEGKCFYSKLPMKIKIESRYENTEVLSIDRIDPDKGYIKGNIVLCCDAVNTMKNNMSLDKFKTFIKIINENFQEMANKPLSTTHLQNSDQI